MGDGSIPSLYARAWTGAGSVVVQVGDSLGHPRGEGCEAFLKGRELLC